MKLNHLIAVGALVASLGAAASADAATQWQKTHPWRAHDNARLANQNARIRQGVKDGQITRAQAQALHADDHAIRTEERADAAVNNGHLTAQDQRQITQQENANSQAIYAARH